MIQDTDAGWMRQALTLARRGLYSTHPNPRVGCVLVRDGVLVGEGWHQAAGMAHAEVHALLQAGSAARGATVYLTLEPCSHHGRTPPCVQALIAAGVARVVVAMQDPNPLVAGSGIAQLKAAGIEVWVGLLEQAARALNPGFIKRMTFGMPYVRVKLAMSLDGRTAMSSGESQWITGTAARSAGQRLRARSAAVITGADTVLQDRARLTVRAQELDLDEEATAWAMRQTPLRVLVDSSMRVPLETPFYQAGPALIATTSANKMVGRHEYINLSNAHSRVDLRCLLALLAEREINEVLVEAGPRLAGAFAQAGLVDEYRLFMAGCFLGSSARPLLEWPLTEMAHVPKVQIIKIVPVGADWQIIALPHHNDVAAQLVTEQDQADYD